MDCSLKEALLSLPVAPLYESLHCGACTLCVLRFFNVRTRVYSAAAPSASEVLRELKDAFSSCDNASDDTAASEACCTVCLGILQSNATQQSVLQASEHHEFESFCIEISVPAATMLRERALWCFMRLKHSSYFKAEHPDDSIVPLKEAARWVILPRLESLLGRRFDANSRLRISLVFRHPASVSELEVLQQFSAGDSKRKRGKNGSAGPEAGESIASVHRILSALSSETFSRHFSCPPSKVDAACELAAACARDAVYVGGRYLKYSRNISQSPWVVDDERMGDGSVQEIIGNVVFPHFKGDSYKFHAAGREDIDVRMLGTGRPFVLEIINARALQTDAQLAKLERLLCETKPRAVVARSLRNVGTEACTLMREGEADKQKEYTAVVWLSRPVTEADFNTLSGLKELEIQQNTPVRVLHRRSPLIRPRAIHWMRCEALPGDKQQYFLLHLCTQAGTYIKEFVHGDFGRTQPSVGSLLDCEAEILCLDVTNVKMDFLDAL